MTTKLTLPLQMFGKLRNHWHVEGEFVKKKVQVGTAVYKSGKKKGQEYPVYDWVIDLKPQKVQVGEKLITRGKNKGRKKPVYETKKSPYYSTGYFPSANAIYMNTGGGRRLNDMAEQKLQEWKRYTEKWAAGHWECQKNSTKVVAEMTFFLPDEKIRDTHNAKKLLLDALEGVIHENDMWILDRTIDFHFDPKFPRIEINFFIKE
jgi:Holliday junction resolvase RusA-like endonuclease